jgi:hypothetical protein
MNIETTADREALDYWSVRDVDQPIGIVPFPCGTYICSDHTVDETDPKITFQPPVVLTAKTGEAGMGA